MSRGRILVAERDGVYLVKLLGDVRLTLCASISDYLQRIFSGPKPRAVYVDLSEAEGVDSTTLGLLARLALFTRDRYALKTRLVGGEEGLLRVFDAMDIAELFERIPAAPDLPLTELPAGEPDAERTRQEVLAAHRLLVNLKPELATEFYDLISSLERNP